MVLDLLRVEQVCEAVEMHPILWDPSSEISEPLRYILSHLYTIALFHINTRSLGLIVGGSMVGGSVVGGSVVVLNPRFRDN